MRNRVSHFIGSVVGFVARQELMVLIVALLILVGGWGFAKVASEVMEGETQTVDSRVLEMLRTTGDDPQPLGPWWLKMAAIDVTSLGGVTVLIVVTAAVVGYLSLRRKNHAALLVIIATIGALALSTALKWTFARPRPENKLHLVEVATASFPSGHAMLSAAVYLTLGALLARLEERQHMKSYILFIAIMLTGSIGLSRVYLGVHYPTDVLAGWCAGLTWAMVCWLAARWLQKRGTIEKTASDPKP